MPEAAWTDLNKYKDSGVFAIADEGTDHWIANITLTKRPTVKEYKYATKADKNISKIRDKKAKNLRKTSDCSSSV